MVDKNRDQKNDLKGVLNVVKDKVKTMSAHIYDSSTFNQRRDPKDLKHG